LFRSSTRHVEKLERGLHNITGVNSLKTVDVGCDSSHDVDSIKVEKIKGVVIMTINSFIYE
jgi:hypothetical protein